MNVVFADAFYFVARLNRRDQHHQRVLHFSRDFRACILTSDWVLMEVADALAESECRGRVREFILHLRRTAACEIVPASRELLNHALDLYHQHADKEWTLTDCVSFVIMRERNVTDALTGDKHFEQAGFTALLK
ncbi:MAG: type II toxin-antitoxin system VapC family toxin [Limisphaerales bacterium]